MSVKWYATTTTQAQWFNADNEVLASTTAPGSGSLTATIAVNTTEIGFAWVTPSGEPNASTWPAGTAGTTDYGISVNVSSIGASLSLVGGAGYVLVGLSDVNTYEGPAMQVNWSSTTGTGVKTTTLYADSIDNVANANTLLSAAVRVNHNGT